ncbi:MAG: primosomal protein N', partial [Microbispora sp.]|nr:primosomal protein N' [Microbispora sp.]
MTEPIPAPHPQEALLPVPPSAAERPTAQPGGTARAGAPKGAREPAPNLPVARVVVDTPLPHLDRPFDYLVPATMDAEAVPGCRVRVRFAGQLADGYLLERLAESEHAGRLSFLERVVSPEPVLTPDIARLARAVADRYAGTMPDILRLAVPPRHARVEAEARTPARRPPGGDVSPPAGQLVRSADPGGGGTRREAAQGDAPHGDADAADTVGARAVRAYGDAWKAYPAGASFLRALAEGRAPRAVWTALPGTDAGGPSWPHAIAAAARATVDGGRGVAVVVPDGKDVALVTAALGETPHVAITADLGPAERYRRWLKALRGEVQIVVGNRPAAYAPVARLGLAVVWDDGDDLHAERHAPYPHTREVLALRAHQAGAGLLIGGYARTAEATVLVETGWAAPLVPDRAVVRARAPRVRPAGDDAELARDQAARAARLPSVAWRALRRGLEHGPVLVQVPRRGYLPALACRNCRAPARCSAVPATRPAPMPGTAPSLLNTSDAA